MARRVDGVQRNRTELKKIAVVEGSAKNIKITTPEDWRLAEILLKVSENLD